MVQWRTCTEVWPCFRWKSKAGHCLIDAGRFTFIKHFIDWRPCCVDIGVGGLLNKNTTYISYMLFKSICKMGENGFPLNIIFLDEAIFYLYEVVNRWNYCFLVSGKATLYKWGHTPQNVNVWSAIDNNIKAILLSEKHYSSTLPRLLKLWISNCSNCYVTNEVNPEFSIGNI